LRYGRVSLPSYFWGGLFALMLVLSLVRLPIEKIKESRVGFVNKFLEILKEILNGWNIITVNKGLLSSLALITLLAFIFQIFLFWIEFKDWGIDTNFMNVVLYNCLLGVFLLVSFTFDLWV
jgi:hypothetical protein